MIHLEVEQGSVEWHKARLAIPTASAFHRMMTDHGVLKTARSRPDELSDGATTYVHELLAAWRLQVPLDSASTAFMERGTDLEREAVGWYELQRDVEAIPGGFVLRDDRRVGCSPDRLVGSDGGLEIKCPGAAKHVANFLNMEGDYLLQVQGCLWLCERDWWDLLSYNPEMPSAIVRVERDEELIEKIADAVDGFLERLDAMRDRLVGMGWKPIERRAPEAVCHGVRDDGRWCLGTEGVQQSEDGEWRCAACIAKHEATWQPPTFHVEGPAVPDAIQDYVFNPQEFEEATPCP